MFSNIIGQTLRNFQPMYLYLLNQTNLALSYLEIIEQLSKTFIIVKDFNVHNKIWIPV